MTREQPADGSPVRVLFVSTKQQPPLGADTWVHLQIMRDLDRSRVEVHAACAPGPRGRPSPTYEAVRQIPDVAMVRVHLGREVAGGSVAEKVRALLSLVPALWGVLRLAWYIHRHRIDVLHTADRPRDAVVCVLLARLTRARCIVHAHVGFNPDWMRPSLQRAILGADARIAISEFVARTLRDGGCDPRTVHVVHNGIELERWTPGVDRDLVRSQLGLGAATPVVLTACRLFRAKGVGELVQAMGDVRVEVPDVVLLVAGAEMEEGYLDELRSMVASSGLDDHVRFLGPRDDVPGLMAAADIFAMPSQYEPFGLVYAEAMAMELPVVGLDNGGTVEVVKDGVTGLLSAADDVPALAAHLRRLLGDPEMRAAFGVEGRRRVAAHFTTRRMADDTAAVYERVVRAEGGADDPSVATMSGRRVGPTPEGTDMQSTLGVDADQFAAAMDRDGYVVMRGVVSKSGLTAFGDELLADFDRLMADGLPFEGGGLMSGHLNCFPGEGSRFIYDELVERGVIELVRSYRPDIADLVRPTLNFNLPGSVAQHYHIDGAYLDDFLICNVAVVDTDLVNGAMDVLPGTNRRFYEFWRYALERKYRLTTRVPLQQGDVVVRKSNLWHRGMPNKSSRARPMMAITFGEVDDAAVDPFLTNGGEIEFYPNWFRTSRLGQLREKTFVRAPATYAAYRFVTSLHGKRGYESW